MRIPIDIIPNIFLLKENIIQKNINNINFEKKYLQTNFKILNQKIYVKKYDLNIFLWIWPNNVLFINKKTFEKYKMNNKWFENDFIYFENKKKYLTKFNVKIIEPYLQISTIYANKLNIKQNQIITAKIYNNKNIELKIKVKIKDNYIPSIIIPEQMSDNSILKNKKWWEI